MNLEHIQTVTVPMEALAEVIELQLKTGGKANLTVTGNSMLPMLHHRKDSVMLVPVEDKQNIGQVILYRRENGRYVLHRIIAVTPDGYVCCGDNQFEKEPVAHRQLIASVVSFTRKGKLYDCSALGYRFYTAIWVRGFFLRKTYIKLRRCLGRLRQKIAGGNVK